MNKYDYKNKIKEAQEDYLFFCGWIKNKCGKWSPASSITTSGDGIIMFTYGPGDKLFFKHAIEIQFNVDEY